MVLVGRRLSSAGCRLGFDADRLPPAPPSGLKRTNLHRRDQIAAPAAGSEIVIPVRLNKSHGRALARTGSAIKIVAYDSICGLNRKYPCSKQIFSFCSVEYFYKCFDLRGVFFD